MQDRLATEGKRGKKVTKKKKKKKKKSVGREGFVEVPVTLWKKVPEEVRCGRKGLRFESERRGSAAEGWERMKKHHQEEGTSRCNCPGSGTKKSGGSDGEGKSGE